MISYKQQEELLLLSYLAGVMDSDGFFSIRKDTYGIRVLKSSKNPAYYEKVGIKQVKNDVVNIIHKKFGGCYSLEKSSSKNGKPLFSIQLTNLKAHNFIKLIYPFLRIKKEQAEILLKLRESISKGKTQVIYVKRKNRWGSFSRFKAYEVSQKEIKYRELLLKKIKKLNDSRSGEAFKPKEYPIYIT